MIIWVAVVVHRIQISEAQTFWRRVAKKLYSKTLRFRVCSVCQAFAQIIHTLGLLIDYERAPF